MKCPKCGNEIENKAKFCKNCGQQLPKVNANNINSKKIIIALIAVAVILTAIAVFASGALTGVELKHEHFDGFDIDVPVDSKFVLTDSITTQPDNVYQAYFNKGEHFYDISAIMVGMNLTAKHVNFDSELMENNGEFAIYKNDSDGITVYKVLKEGNKANVCVMGSNLDALKKIAHSFNDKDFAKLATTSSTTKQTSSSSSSSTTESGDWVSIGSYSGSGSGSETVNVPEGKIMVKLSAYPIKNYDTNHLYVSGSNGESGGVDWGSKSAVETRSDSFTYTSTSSETFTIDYYETVSWEVEFFKYQ